ncbi:tripartite motif-containing protein 3-like [Branchiostoma lanceolatum]|uniref:tripartite motif-containing protein 3-like n=1 Tax=Branchiostoma lanceolatum TaxID=7740 RepID=UPI003455A332
MHQTNPMSEAHRTLLLRNYPTIYQDLDATRVLDYLHEHRVITEEMRQEILTIPVDQRHQRTRRLLDMILQSGDDAFITFRTALGHAGYLHLVELLTGGQQQLMPPMPMAVAIYPGFQGSESQSFDLSIGEQPEIILQKQLDKYTTVYQNEQILQLKTKMRDEELKALYIYEERKVKSLKRAKSFLSQKSLKKRFDKLQVKVEDERAIIVSTYRGCVILFLTFESEPKFEHFWGSCTSGDLSTSLSELLLTEEMRGLEGGDQLVVKTLVLEQDVRAWRDFFGNGDPQHPDNVQVEQVTSQLASLDTSRQTEELQVRQKIRAGSIRSIASTQSATSTLSSGSVLSSDSGYASAGSHRTLSEGRKIAAKYKVSVEAAISTITEGMEKVDRKITATKENCQEVEKEIQQHYKRLRAKLKLEEQEMITRVQKVNRDRKGELTQEKEKMETELKKTKEAEISVQKILDCKDDTEALILRQDMEEKFKKLSFQETDDRSLESPTKVTFQPCSLSQVSGGSLSVFAGFSIDVEEPAVESLPCFVTVTTNKADLTGGDVAPQIEVTSPQGKTTLIHTTAHTSPQLAAGKGQTSRVRRVWGAEWRPQTSGKHSLGVCMGGNKDLGSLTVDVGSNNPVLRFGQKGSQQGQFNKPLGVAVRGDRLYVADNTNHRVQVFDLSGNFCHTFSTTSPAGLAVQADGTIVVKSRKEDLVKKFSPSGELLHKFSLGEYCTNPYSLAVQRDGRVVVTDTYKHSIFLVEADGTLVKQVGGQGQGEGQFESPLFVCVDKEDNIIVAEKVNHRVQVFDKNLNFKHKFGQKGRQPQDMFGPMGVSADSRGNIVLANIGGTTDGVVGHSKKLQVFCPDGTWVSTISSDGDKLHNPLGVAVTEDGHVFVADPEDHCIRKYRYL